MVEKRTRGFTEIIEERPRQCIMCPNIFDPLVDEKVPCMLCPACKEKSQQWARKMQEEV